MDIRRQDQDDEIIRLLGKLSDAAPEYPSNMFNKRRAAIMAAFAALNLGAATAGLGLIAGLVKTVKAMGVVEKVILGVEVAAVTGMTAYGAATAYIHRDEIRQILQQSFGVATSTPWPSLAAPGGPGGAETQITVLGTETMTPTPSPTPTGTWYPTVTEPSNQNPVDTAVAPTNPPVVKVTPTNCGEGNCYGKSTRTPKPKP